MFHTALRHAGNRELGRPGAAVLGEGGGAVRVGARPGGGPPVPAREAAPALSRTLRPFAALLLLGGVLLIVTLVLQGIAAAEPAAREDREDPDTATGRGPHGGPAGSQALSGRLGVAAEPPAPAGREGSRAPALPVPPVGWVPPPEPFRLARGQRPADPGRQDADGTGPPDQAAAVQPAADGRAPGKHPYLPATMQPSLHAILNRGGGLFVGYINQAEAPALMVLDSLTQRMFGWAPTGDPTADTILHAATISSLMYGLHRLHFGVNRRMVLSGRWREPRQFAPEEWRMHAQVSIAQIGFEVLVKKLLQDAEWLPTPVDTVGGRAVWASSGDYWWNLGYDVFFQGFLSGAITGRISALPDIPAVAAERGGRPLAEVRERGIFPFYYWSRLKYAVIVGTAAAVAQLVSRVLTDPPPPDDPVGAALAPARHAFQAVLRTRLAPDEDSLEDLVASRRLNDLEASAAVPLSLLARSAMYAEERLILSARALFHAAIGDRRTASALVAQPAFTLVDPEARDAARAARERADRARQKIADLVRRRAPAPTPPAAGSPPAPPGGPEEAPPPAAGSAPAPPAEVGNEEAPPPAVEHPVGPLVAAVEALPPDPDADAEQPVRGGSLTLVVDGAIVHADGTVEATRRLDLGDGSIVEAGTRLRVDGTTIAAAGPEPAPEGVERASVGVDPAPALEPASGQPDGDDPAAAGPLGAEPPGTDPFGTDLFAPVPG